MAPEEKKAPKKRKIKIKIRHHNNNNNNNSTATPSLESFSVDQVVFDLLRNQALQQIATADDSKFRTPEEQMQVVDAGYRYLATFGFEGNELKKAWKEMGDWRA